MATLEQLKAQSDDTLSIGEVAEQTGLGYIEIWRRIDHGKLVATQGASNEFRIHTEELPALQLIAQQRAATESRSMTLARAARALRMQHKTARQLLDSGELVEDHNPTGNGWIYVTNESVAAAVKHRQRRMRGRRLDESGLVEIQVAADRSGRTRAELQELVRAGVLQRVQKSGKTYLREQGLIELADRDE